MLRHYALQFCFVIPFIFLFILELSLVDISGTRSSFVSEFRKGPGAETHINRELPRHG